MKTDKDFELLFYAFHRRLLGFAISLTGEPGTSEEIVQDVFMSVWGKKDQLNLDESLKPYLFKSTRNACYDYLKKNKPQLDTIDGNIPVFSDENPETRLLYNESRKKVWESIDKLPLRCREVFLLSRMEKFSNKQIAETLDISVKTVENQMTRALKTLREEIFSKKG